ncbi:hypothetical protein DVU_0229 [Nitratidesulfovibrio vulgaris str. Hildenborough]|uniref:Uncharacterized protein n=1 Tax=Nitratidesulfovibrio vulgaris (strain ATCC 29579 / DSM 644 / CCUG 34227 / NCIMB 8303 / VKM B-1760 / Hildenborough) TaxID=882 RepID=Q72FI4_NITV2|nr:hypothetical protein DVU_0229 [Nitratidesulfovibrio vulgaris str. Hildenborough]
MRRLWGSVNHLPNLSWKRGTLALALNFKNSLLNCYCGFICKQRAKIGRNTIKCFAIFF